MDSLENQNEDTQERVNNLNGNLNVGRSYRGFTYSAVTELTDENLGQLADIYARAFSGAPWFEKWEAESAREEICSLLRKDSTFILVMSGQIISGFAVMYSLENFRSADKIISFGIPKSAMYLAEVAVRPEFQGNGIASVLVQKAFLVALKTDSKTLVSQTRDDNLAMIKCFTNSKLEYLNKHEEQTGGVLSKRLVYFRAGKF